jgi:hypothetical protein
MSKHKKYVKRLIAFAELSADMLDMVLCLKENLHSVAEQKRAIKKLDMPKGKKRRKEFKRLAKAAICLL